MSSTLDLLKRASWRAEVLFKQRGSFRTIVWLTEDAGGHRAQFETACSAPVGISNDEVLSALGREMAADFRRDAVGVVRFAVAYPARIVTISTMLGGERLRRQVQIVAVEAHDDSGAHLRGTREIIHRGRAPAVCAIWACRFAGRVPSGWTGRSFARAGAMQRVRPRLYG